NMALAAILIAGPEIVAGDDTDMAQDVAVRAALLYNFAKFTEWPDLPAAAPIVVCVVGDDRIAVAVVKTVRGQKINGHTLDVLQLGDSATWRNCQLLFIAGAELRRVA